MPKSFRQAFKAFFNPESAEVNLGIVRVKYTDAVRDDVAKVLPILRKKNVLFARIENELWRDVFASLRELRDALSETSGKIHVRGPGSVRAALDFMVDVVAIYLAEFEASYERHMESCAPPRAGYITNGSGSSSDVQPRIYLSYVSYYSRQYATSMNLRLAARSWIGRLQRIAWPSIG